MNRRSFTRLIAAAASGPVSAGLGARGAQAAPDGRAEVEAFVAQRRFAETSFGRIAYVERGQGPAALFLHGFPLNGFQWRGQLERLSAVRRCVAPDSLGLGYSEVRPGQGVTPADQMRMLAALLDQLSIDSVDLVANDSGGAVAQLFLIAHPERVRSLLLTNCDVEGNSPPPLVLPVIDLARQGLFARKQLAPALADKDLVRSPNDLGGLTFTYPERLTDAALDYYLRPLVARPELTDAYALGLTPDPLAGAEPHLRRCTAPVRIVWGTGDPIFSAASPDYLADVLPGSRGVRRVPGAKLFFPEEFPDLIAEEAKALWGVQAA